MIMTELSGFLIIDKPKGITSHDVIAVLRKITGLKKIGHAGTLDPFAGGVLIVGIGRSATRHLSKFSRMDKKYHAVLRLGSISDTYDLTGKIKKLKSRIDLAGRQKSKIKGVLENFIGKQKQVPPIYSAKKIRGKKAYEFARKGEKIKLKPQEIEIYDIKIIKNLKLNIENSLILDIHCSSGTYIRSLANDIGQKLGCGAYVEDLVRLSIDNFTLNDSVRLPLKLIKKSIVDKLTSKLFEEFKYSLNNPIISPDNWQKHLINFSQVICFGTFDILHPGHFYFLKQAKTMGKNLTVVVARDAISFKIKKTKPLYNEKQRVNRLKKLSFIDEVRLGDLDNPYKCLKEIKPDLICLGYDQSSFTTGLCDKISDIGLKTKICRLDAFEPHKYKSSILSTLTQA